MLCYIRLLAKATERSLVENLHSRFKQYSGEVSDFACSHAGFHYSDNVRCTEQFTVGAEAGLQAPTRNLVND